MFKRQDYSFDLPEDLIAQYPSEKRDHSRLLHVNRSENSFTDKKFTDIIDIIQPDDCLIINNTRVIPARLMCKKIATDANIELLLLKPLSGNRWQSLIKPSKKVAIGTQLKLSDADVEVIDHNKENQTFTVQFNIESDMDAFIEAHGSEPLPPYIKRHSEQLDKERYQTVYAKEKGAVAAPTAGLHFTDDILNRLEDKGVTTAEITLHVGLGTFRPVKVEEIKTHHMHSEFYSISAESAKKINMTKAHPKGRLICVGTTSVRCIESATDKNGVITAQRAETDIFIYPGYRFKSVDALITNFHTPESTLLMLVSAFADFELIKNAYKHAVQEKYRFFSYGDSMFIE